MTVFSQYDPTDPPPEGIPADPLPPMFAEGDEEETNDSDSWRPTNPTTSQRLRYRFQRGMKVKNG